MEKEIVVVGAQEGTLTATRSPQAIIAEARERAKALKDIVSKKEKPVIMNGEQYLEFEDWQTCGKFYGLTAKVVSTEPLDFNGGARGFKAKAVVVDNSTGIEVSAAEAICLNDEDKWSTRAKYESKNGHREKVGEVPVPMFQLMSMAQTRACAKALRNVLAWVVVLAGYKPTTAEDLTGDEGEASSKITPPKQKTETTGKSGLKTATFVPADVNHKSGSKDGNAWTKTGIKSPAGEWFGTFDSKAGEDATQAKKQGLEIEITYTNDGKYNNIETLKVLTPAEN